MSLDEGVIRKIVSEEVAAGLKKKAAKKPTIINKTMTKANTEYKLALPARTKKFLLKMRTTDADFIMAFERGSIDGASPAREYFTVHMGDVYYEDELDLEEIFHVFVACASAAKTIELIAWC